MSKAFSTFQRLHRCEAGATAVEFAIIGMIMVTTSLGLIEFGRGLYMYNKISHAADLAARKALVEPNASAQTLKNEVLAAFAGDEASPNVEIKTPAVASEVAYRILVVQLSFDPLVPGLMSDPITLQVIRRIPMLS